MTTDLGGRVEAGVATAAQVEVGAGTRHQQAVNQTVFSLRRGRDQKVREVWRSEAEVSATLGQCPHYVHVARPHSAQQGTLVVVVPHVDTGAPLQQPPHHLRLPGDGGRVEGRAAAVVGDVEVGVVRLQSLQVVGVAQMSHTAEQGGEEDSLEAGHLLPGAETHGLRYLEVGLSADNSDIVTYLFYQLKRIPLVVDYLLCRRVHCLELCRHLTPDGELHGSPLHGEVPVVFAEDVAELGESGLRRDVTARDDPGVYESPTGLVDPADSPVAALSAGDDDDAGLGGLTQTLEDVRSVAGHVPGPVTLQDNSSYWRLQEMFNRLSSDGGKQPQQDDIPAEL